MKKVVGVSSVYPSVMHPESGTFVQSLMNEMYAQGMAVKLVAPRLAIKAIADQLRHRVRFDELSTGSESFGVYRPTYWSTTPRIVPWRGIGAHIWVRSYRRCVVKSLYRHLEQDSYVHAYFLDSAWAAQEACRELRVPLVVEVGESDLDHYKELFGESGYRNLLEGCDGVVAVSQRNYNYCKEICPTLEDRLIYLPNAVDTAQFHPQIKHLARAKLGLPADGSIAIFCGHFIERKGPLRVCAAIEKLDNVSGVFIGNGCQVPMGPHVLHAGPVPNSMMPSWLAAADVFVLPSLAEGMSVALVEALAVGLPVVVSDRAFNRDFLTAECAEFVDPTNVDSIASGLRQVLYDDTRRTEMSRSAMKVAMHHSLQERTTKLLHFVSNVAVQRRRQL